MLEDQTHKFMNKHLKNIFHLQHVILILSHNLNKRDHIDKEVKHMKEIEESNLD